MKKSLFLLIVLVGYLSMSLAQQGIGPRVKTKYGELEGVHASGISIFKGVPFAAPPVGQFRWREPQPVQPWTGVRMANQFGPRAMQLPIFGDMNFRSNGVNEDCLYLNIWTPKASNAVKLPVLVYFYGGGFMAGDGSEPRYDGESMARNGIVAITVNYRLGVFGFLAHPELTKESPFHASGNYGLMDQGAALQWVQQNITAFGGDPKRITIAGESAGSWSVSAQMASPLSRNIIAGAIAESGALLGGKTATLSEAEKAGVKWAESIKKTSLAELRAMSAEEVLKAAAGAGFGAFPVCVDGHFFPQSPQEIFAKGQQAKVPLMAGWNTQESGPQMILGNGPATVENFRKGVERIHGANAEKILKVYQPTSDAEVEQVATDLAGDMFIGFGTWMLTHVHSGNSGKPVYRYLYARPRPQMRPEMGNAQAGLAGGVIRDTSGKAKAPAPAAKGAVHSAEIEYAMGNLPTNRVYDWQPDDFVVSAIMQGYFANFIKTGNPNGMGLPNWPGFSSQSGAQVMRIDVNAVAGPSKVEDRYQVMKELMPR